MSYRDPLDALRLRRDHLAAELAASRRAADDARAHEARAGALEKELADVEAMLRDAATPPATKLEDIRIASPCNARWEDMVGDDQVRFCGQCSKNVYNLSAMARVEAEALIQGREGALCTRLYRRADGTVLTADCPTGEQKKRRRLLVLAVAGSGLMAAGAALAQQATTTMGEVAPRPVETVVDEEPSGAQPVLGPRRSHGLLQDHGQRETEEPRATPPAPERPTHTLGLMILRQ